MSNGSGEGWDFRDPNEHDDDRGREDAGELIPAIPDTVLMVLAGDQYLRRVFQCLASKANDLTTRFANTRAIASLSPARYQ